MNSWLVWGVFAIAVVFLGWVGYHFTVRTLRFVTLAFAAAVVVLVAGYGATHPARAPTDLVNAFIRGVDQLSGAFFQPLLPGHGVFVPGRFGWLVIIAVFVFAYRELEAWAMRWQPPAVDTSALGGSKRDRPRSSARGGEPDEQSVRDRLAAELRFRLPAVEVRAPSILPGGAMPNGLASIAENSGVAGGGLPVRSSAWPGCCGRRPAGTRPGCGSSLPVHRLPRTPAARLARDRRALASAPTTAGNALLPT